MDVLISQESDASLDLDSVPLPSFSRLGQTPAALHLQPQPGRSTLRGFNATIHTLVSALEELSSTLNLDSTFGSSSSSSSSGPSRPAINPSWPLKAATPSPTMSPVLPHPVSHLAVAIPGAATRGEAATADPMKRASIPPTPLSPVTATSRASMAPGSTSDSAQQEFGALVAKRKRSSISWPGGEDVGSLPGSGRGEEQFKSRRLAAGLSSRFSRSVNVEDEGGGGTEGTPFGWGPVLDGDRAGSSSAWRHVARPRERVHETGSGPFGRQGNAGGPGEVLMLGEQAQAEDAMMDEDHEAISPAETDDDASGHIDLSGPNGARGWDMKRLELEHNCMLLQNGVFPRDSYDDMRLITERILDCARTLAGGPDFCTLDAIVPAWRSVKPTVERVWHFIQVTEDMKALAASNWQMDPNGLDDSLKGMRALLEEKSRLYGDALGLNGLPWKMLGFPVDEQLLDSVSLWMLALPWRYLLLIDTTLSSGKESFGPQQAPLVDYILNGLLLTSEFVTYLRRPCPTRMEDLLVSLTTLYLNWVSQAIIHLSAPTPRHHHQQRPGSPRKGASTTTKSADAKVALLIDNSITCLETLRSVTAFGAHHLPVARSGRVTSIPRSPRLMPSTSAVPSAATSPGRASPALLQQPSSGGHLATGFHNAGDEVEDSFADALLSAVLELGLRLTSYVGARSRATIKNSASLFMSMLVRYVKSAASLVSLEHDIQLKALMRKYDAE